MFYVIAGLMGIFLVGAALVVLGGIVVQACDRLRRLP